MFLSYFNFIEYKRNYMPKVKCNLRSYFHIRLFSKHILTVNNWYFLHLQVSPDDRLPHVICESCLEKVDAFFTFKDLSKKSEKVLEQFLAYTYTLVGTSEVRSVYLSAVLVVHVGVSYGNAPHLSDFPLPIRHSNSN